MAAFDFLKKWGFSYEVFKDTGLNTALYIIIIIMVGLFFYSFDFPRKLRRRQEHLPSVHIKNRHPEINEQEIMNNYFDFYDDLNIKYKYKHEKYSGYFHLSLNMALISLLILFVSLLSYCKGHFSYFLYTSTLILILSIIISINIYNSRLIQSYDRHLKKYYKSEFYEELKKKNE